MQPIELRCTSLMYSFDVQTKHFVKLFCCCSVKVIFSAEFHSVLFRASELALPRNSECLGMSAFFRGITEPILSLFRGIFSERNSVPNPTHRWTSCTNSPTPQQAQCRHATWSGRYPARTLLTLTLARMRAASSPIWPQVRMPTQYPGEQLDKLHGCKITTP